MSDIPTTHTLPEDALRLMRTAFRMDPRSARCLEAAETELTRLRAALAEAQAVRSGVTRHIPMNFLQAHDAPGATGPTKALDLVAAVRAWAESRWEDRRRAEALVERSKETERDRDAAKAEAERLREALGLISSYVGNLRLDPDWPRRIARAALQEKEKSRG